MAGYSVSFTVIDEATAKINAINQRIRQMREPMERQAKALQQFVDISGLKKVADGFTGIARSAADAFNSLVRIVPVMGTLTGAASIAGITKLVESWNAFSGGLSRDAARIGTTAAQLQRYQDIITLAGGSTEDMTAGLKELAQAMGDAVTGDAQKFSIFLNQLGINLYDANGQLKTAAQAMPEVLAALDKIPGAYDRQKVAAAAGIPGLVALVNQLDREKQTGESLIDTWNRLNTEAGKYADITKDQEAAQHRYETAIGALSVAFTHLKEGVGAVIGEALTPLLNQLAEFVRTHTPEITAAIQQIVTGFSDWIKGIDWASVKSGADSVVDALKFVGEHLNTIVKVALVIKGLQIATGIVSSITSIMGVIGTIGGVTGGALLAGTGLLGALGLVVWLSTEIYRHWDEIKGAISAVGDAAVSAGKQVMQSLGNIHLPGAGEGPPAPEPGAGPPRPSGEITPMYGGTAEQPSFLPAIPFAPPIVAPATPPADTAGFFEKVKRGFAGGGPPGLPPAPPIVPPVGAPSATPASYANIAEQRAPLMAEVERDPATKRLLYQMMKTEGGGAATVEALFNRVAMVRQQVPDYSIKDELRSGFYGPIKSGVAERTEISEKEQAQFDKTLSTVVGGSNIIQGRTNQGMATDPGAGLPGRVQVPGSSEVYNFWEGRRRGVNFGMGSSAAFATQQTALANAMQPAAQAAAVAAAPQAEGKPIQVTGGPPVSGSVDVTVTHRNPPPGVTVTAQGQGDVNVASPRTEQASLSI